MIRRSKPLWCSAILLCFGASPACKTDAPAAGSEPLEQEAFTPVTFADSVAAAHGFGGWGRVERLDFDFAVDVADTNRTMRSWSWYPRLDSVVRQAGGGEPALGFVRNAPLDSLGLAADGDFINDSYWLLMPFYLVWSRDGYESAVTYRDTLPLAGTPGTKLTVQYRPTGGYTPGDAYDLYVDADYRLREWSYRPGGTDTVRMTMTWADYRTVEGLELPAEHRGGGPVRIHHPRVEVFTAE